MLGKIKVYELAKELGIPNSEMIEMLKKSGVEVKSHLSTLEEDVVSNIRKKGVPKKEVKKEAKKTTEQKSEQMHIIRRKVKVINTDGEKEEVEQITTNIAGDIKKSHHTIVEKENKTNAPYKKDGLGVVTPRQPYGRKNMANRRVNNVIITRNGKLVEAPKPEVVEEKPVEQAAPTTAPKAETTPTTNKPQRENRSSYPQRNNNNGYRSNNNGYNNNRTQGPRNTQEGRQQNNGYRSNNNNYNNYNRNDRGNNNNNGGYRNNNYNNNNNGNTGYNRNNTDRPNRPGFRGNNNNTGNNNGGFRNNNNNYRGNNTTYQVNKFIKQASTQPVEQKETRDYNNVPERKKFTPDRANDKKDRLDKNKLREERSRVSTSRFKGMEVNSKSGLFDLYDREGDSFRKGGRRKKKEKIVLNQTKIIPMTEVKLPEVMSVKEFAESIKKQASEVIKKLFGLGIMATVNQEIDFDTAYLIAEEFGITAEKQVVVTDEDILFDESEDDEKDLLPRAPIVAVMGHVDHGKTSLLDKIRSANVVGKEAGGITQHIGAYKVKCKGKEICFLDTPGHEAFTAMRARGAQITDIAIIIVAADDGIKPQTIEAIDHAKAAGVSIIVAINKIDKPTANVERVKQELLEVGLVAEEWGGDTICIPISAATGEGIDNLLEMILLVSEMKDLKANPNKQAKGTVIEARLDKNIGTVVSLLVQRGTLNVSDTIVVGEIVGKVRAMKDDKGKNVKSAGPSTPVEIIGLSQVPQTGDVFYEVENDKVAKHLVEKRKAKHRRELIKQGSKVTLDDLFGQIKEGKIKDLNVIIKADVQGSVEALKESLLKLSNDEVRVRILHASTGGIKESDVTLASVSNAIIIGFNVRPEARVEQEAKKEKVDLRLYRVIYDAIEDVETALKGLMPKKYTEVMYGTCEVRKVFNITGVGAVAGCYVTKGKVVRGTMVRLVRDSIVVFEIKIDSLKREKDDVKEVAEGYECGIRLQNFNDVKEGDILECFEMIEEKRD